MDITGDLTLTGQLTMPRNVIEHRIVESAGSALQHACHTAAYDAGWWQPGWQHNPFAFSNKLMLVVSELAEAMEGDRKNLMDDKLPRRSMREVELADAVIRIFDMAGAFGMDLGGAIAEKMAFNAVRPDHKPEARAADGGKKY
jgi:NTP pyrophosphatase (non-canonical NTP hydrolase)